VATRRPVAADRNAAALLEGGGSRRRRPGFEVPGQREAHDFRPVTALELGLDEHGGGQHERPHRSWVRARLVLAARARAHRAPARARTSRRTAGVATADAVPAIVTMVLVATAGVAASGLGGVLGIMPVVGVRRRDRGRRRAVVGARVVAGVALDCRRRRVGEGVPAGSARRPAAPARKRGRRRQQDGHRRSASRGGDRGHRGWFTE
jgi:hypothetical protein